MRRALIVFLILVGIVSVFHLATRHVPISVKVNDGLEEAAKRLIEEHRQ